MVSDDKRRKKEQKKAKEIARRTGIPVALAPAPPPQPPPPPPPLECSGDLAYADQYLKDIKIQNLTISLNGEELITNSTFSLRYGSFYGVVNSGGSEGTLFRAMAEGLFPFPSYFEVSCPIYKPEYGHVSVRKYVTSREDVRQNIELGQATLASLDAGNSDAMKCLNKRLKALRESADEVAARILYALGFDKQMQSGRADSLHSSWQKPLALARTLFLRPPIILLDEPTDYLDLERCLWLSKWIVDNLTQKSIVVIKSNDEAFLNQVCTEFIHVENCEVQQVNGNYDEFLQSKLQSDAVVRCDKLMFRARPLDQQLAPPILHLSDASFGYGDGKLVFQNMSFDVTLSSRVAIVGTKQSGKSALLDVLRGTAALKFTGTRNCNSNLSIGYFHPGLVDELNLTLSAWDHLYTVSQGSRKLINEVIEFAQPAALRKPMRNLSRGQKTLIVLACLAIKSPHILLLDEPFKGLDVETMGSIARALMNWNGAFVLASNNMKLIHSVTSDIWVCGSLGLAKYNGDIMDLKRQIQTDNNRMVNLQDPAIIRGTYPQFAVASGDVAHPTVWYQEHIDAFNESFKSGCIPLADFIEDRAMVSNAPCRGLKEGEMDFPFEIVPNKTYRMIADPGKRISRSLLGAVHYSELALECFSDFDIKNVMVTPNGTIRLKGVKRKKLCPHQLRRNHMSCHEIIKNMCSEGGAVPEDVQYLLDMIEFEPEMSPIYHVQACLVPLCSVSPFYTKLFEHLRRFMKNTALEDQILLEMPYIGTDQELMSVQGAAWHGLAKSNLIIEKTYNHVPGHFALQPLQVLPGHVAITPQQLRDRRLREAKNLTDCLRNRVAHRMDYLGSLQYSAKASDLATHARFSKVSCVLQKELHKANQTEELGLDEFLQENR